MTGPKDETETSIEIKCCCKNHEEEKSETITNTKIIKTTSEVEEQMKSEENSAEDKVKEIDKDEEKVDNKVEKLPMKVSDYIEMLLKEKELIDVKQCPEIVRLIEQRIKNIHERGGIKMANTVGGKYRLIERVLIPINRKGSTKRVLSRLIGSKGSNMKRMEKETKTRMMVKGRGSTLDRIKEKEDSELLNSKFDHLSSDLHIEIWTSTLPEEAHIRMANAIQMLRKLFSDLDKEEIGLLNNNNNNINPWNNVVTFNEPMVRQNQIQPFHNPDPFTINSQYNNSPSSMINQSQVMQQQYPNYQHIQNNGISTFGQQGLSNYPFNNNIGLPITEIYRGREEERNDRTFVNRGTFKIGRHSKYETRSPVRKVIETRK